MSNAAIRDAAKDIESCFKNEDGTVKLMALVPLGKVVKLMQAIDADTIAKFWREEIPNGLNETKDPVK